MTSLATRANDDSQGLEGDGEWVWVWVGEGGVSTHATPTQYLSAHHRGTINTRGIAQVKCCLNLLDFPSLATLANTKESNRTTQ